MPPARRDLARSPRGSTHDQPAPTGWLPVPPRPPRDSTHDQPAPTGWLPVPPRPARDSTHDQLVLSAGPGDKVPRKGGPGVTTADLLVINKTDLAPLVGAGLSVMERDAAARRGDLPTVSGLR